jgi:TRAP-type C4-dicarboxylate transport system permease small subunit
MKDVFLRLNDVLYAICIWVSGMAIAAMSLIIPWGIFTRYVLGTGSQWPEPIAILLMVIFTFLGAAAGVRAGVHIAVGMLTERLPSHTRQRLATVATLLVGLVALFMIGFGSRLCMATWGQSISEIPSIPVGATYLPVPVSGFLTLMFVLERLWLGPQTNRPIVRYDHEDTGRASTETR